MSLYSPESEKRNSDENRKKFYNFKSNIYKNIYYMQFDDVGMLQVSC